MHAVALAVLVGSSPAVTAPFSPQAQQGSPEATTDRKEFKSPMVLTARFAAVDRSLWNRGWVNVPEYMDLGQYRCEGVSLQRMQMAVKTNKAEPALVSLRYWVYNPAHNHDKAVTIAIELLDGTNPVHTARVRPLKVEDKGTGKENLTVLQIPMEFLSRQPALTLRITVSAKDI